MSTKKRVIKVAIDSSATVSGHAVRGIGVMVREEIKAIKQLHDKVIELDAFDFESQDGKVKLEKGKYDIIHYPYFFPYALTLPELKHANKVVVTIQDLIHLIYPKSYPPGFKGQLNLFRQKRGLKNIDAVITISETSKKDIVRFLGFPADKVYVVYLAPQRGINSVASKKTLDGIKSKYGLPEKYVLYVGDVNYNKNIPGLIEACKIAGVPLVIVGKHAMEIEELGVDLRHIRGPRDWFRFLFNIPHPELAHFKGLVDEFKNNPDIIRLGFVEKSEFSAVFQLASVYVQPSFYEGFGIPVLEAFKEKVPVVISKTNALVEIAGGAALIADPKNPKDLADKIAKVLKSKELQQRLVKKGSERLKDFSWEETAKEMVGVYKTISKKK